MTRNLVQRAGDVASAPNVKYTQDPGSTSRSEIATEYDLTLTDIHAALAYYHAHQGEIDQSIRESERFADALRARTPSKLAPGIV